MFEELKHDVQMISRWQSVGGLIRIVEVGLLIVILIKVW